MELRHLRYFEAVAATRNFSRAAEVLGVAQPPLSRQIRDLEEELGVTLFDRDSRPIRLTEAGRVFHEQATQLLAGGEQLRKSMRRFASIGQRRFVIGFVGSILYGAMPKMIRQFRAEAPQVEVRLLELTTLEQVAALKDGRIDAGLGRIRIDDPAIRREVLLEEGLIAALASDHALAEASGAIGLQQLAPYDLIVYPSQPRPSYADQVLSAFRDRGLRPAQIVEVREMQTALGLVAAHCGVAVVPASMKRMQREDVVYRDLTDRDVTSPIIMSRRVGDMSAEAGLFERIGRAAYAAHA